MDDWNHKESWYKNGDKFCVEIVKSKTCKVLYHGGDNLWCVYAYIYPEHQHFSRFSGESIWQDSAKILPMHGGASMLRWHFDKEGIPVSVQVGADYDHIYDEDYRSCGTAEDAAPVFRDAQELFDWLESANWSEPEDRD